MYNYLDVKGVKSLPSKSRLIKLSTFRSPSDIFIFVIYLKSLVCFLYYMNSLFENAVCFYYALSSKQRGRNLIRICQVSRLSCAGESRISLSLFLK